MFLRKETKHESQGRKPWASQVRPEVPQDCGQGPSDAAPAPASARPGASSVCFCAGALRASICAFPLAPPGRVWAWPSSRVRLQADISSENSPRDHVYRRQRLRVLPVTAEMRKANWQPQGSHDGRAQPTGPGPGARSFLPLGGGPFPLRPRVPLGMDGSWRVGCGFSLHRGSTPRPTSIPPLQSQQSGASWARGGQARGGQAPCSSLTGLPAAAVLVDAVLWLQRLGSSRLSSNIPFTAARVGGRSNKLPAPFLGVPQAPQPRK